MDTKLQTLCDSLVENKHMLSQTFKYNLDLINLTTAYLFAAAGKQADGEALKAAEALIKEKTGKFSIFRSKVSVPLCAKMVLSGEPEAYFDRVFQLHELVNEGKRSSSEYNVLTAQILEEHAGDQDPQTILERSRELYARMKKEHPWLTSKEDLILASLLAAKDTDLDRLNLEMEACFQTLKEHFRDANAVQSMSHVLALGNQTADEKCGRMVRLVEGLKAEGHKYGSGFTLAALAGLALLEVSVEQLVREIAEADDYLEEQKGFGNFRLGADKRRMFAAQLVQLLHQAESPEAGEIMLGGAIAYTIAMEVTMIIIMCSVIPVTVAN